MTSLKSKWMKGNRKRQEQDAQRRRIARTSSMLRRDSRQQVADELQTELSQFRSERTQQAAQWRQATDDFRESLTQDRQNFQQQVQDFLVNIQIDRSVNTEILHKTLAEFRADLQKDVQQCLAAMKSDREKTEATLKADLSAYRETLRDSIETLLSTLQSSREEQAAALAEELAAFHEDLSVAVSDFLHTAHSDRVVMAQDLSQMRNALGNLLKQYRQSRCVETTQMKESLTQFRRRLAQQSRERIATSTQERQARAAQVQQSLRDFNQSLVASTEQFLTEAAQNRQIQGEALRRDLSHFCQEISSGVDVYLSQCRVDLQQASRVRSEQSVKLREDLKQFRANLYEEVWGDGTPEPIAPVAISVRVATPAPPVSPPQPSFTSGSIGNGNTLEKVYQFVLDHPGSRLAEIEAGVGLNRIQIVDALQSLNEQSRITQQDRAYFILGGDQ